MIAIVSFLVLVVYYGENQWNPIKEIRQLKNQQRRNDAIVLVNVLKDNRICAGDEIDSLDMKVSFGPLKMAKAFILNGTIKGQVSYTYSSITRSNLIVHSIKALEKYRLASLLIPLVGFSVLLSILHPYLPWAVFFGSIICMASIVGMSLKKYQGSLPGCQRSQSSAALPFRFFLRPERQEKTY